MKKLFLLLALLGMVAVGCSKDKGGNIPDDAYISLDKEIVTISPDGESVGVKVYSNYAWELTNNCDWITTSITSGDASDTGVTITLTADLTYDDREGTIVFSCGKAKKLLVVSQKFKEAIIPDGNNTFDIPAEGGHAVITYQTTVDCEVIIPDEAQDWVTITPSTRGLVSESSTLNIAENTTYSARTAVIKVVAKDNAEIFVKYTINQEQKNGVLVDGNNTFTVPGIGGSVVIKYQANIDCDVIIPEEAQDWITIAPATRGLVTYNTTLNIAENNSGKERSCMVKVVSQGDNELFAEYTIIQNPRYYLYYTSNDSEIVQPYRSSAFGATILSNTYKDGVGVIEFNTPITKIGDGAFDCCSCLTSVTIPDSVTTIGRYAFVECSSLTSVTIPDSVMKIGNYAFQDCDSLTSVYISDIAAWCNISFSGSYSNPLSNGCNLYLNNELVTDLTIPDSVTTIGSSAFSYCISLTSVTIGDSVTTIGDYAFYYCSSLTSVTIPDSVTTIGEYAFYRCDSLTSVTIPDSVTTIGWGAFDGCSSLTSVTIPDSVTTIGEDVFYGCTGELIINSKIVETDYSYDNCPTNGGWLNGAKFTKLTIGDSVTTIGEYVFAYCSSLTSVTIPDSVTTIGDYAFRNCESLTSATIPDSVTSIGDGAFALCSSLTSVTIPDSVTTIDGYAFYYCYCLTSVTIGDSVTTIGDSAFGNCESLTSVYCKATTPPAVILSYGYKWLAFDYNASGRVIYVPTESVEAYKTAEGWSRYADAIEGYNF